ncbi:hypothetical protein C8J57DRAFT_1282027 [Mycena rebaudengoi]|nr:hypothetical protein C8J57DRAFT_1282027 [Mycena rebaudengoi]
MDNDEEFLQFLFDAEELQFDEDDYVPPPAYQSDADYIATYVAGLTLESTSSSSNILPLESSRPHSSNHMPPVSEVAPVRSTHPPAQTLMDAVIDAGIAQQLGIAIQRAPHHVLMRSQNRAYNSLLEDFQNLTRQFDALQNSHYCLLERITDLCAAAGESFARNRWPQYLFGEDWHSDPYSLSTGSSSSLASTSMIPFPEATSSTSSTPLPETLLPNSDPYSQEPTSSTSMGSTTTTASLSQFSPSSSSPQPLVWNAGTLQWVDDSAMEDTEGTAAALENLEQAIAAWEQGS